MAFQSIVNAAPARGVNGDRAGLNPCAYYLPVPVAASGGVVTGRACWISATDPNAVTNATSGSSAPLGIAQRVLTGVIPSGQEATMVISAGMGVAVVVRSDLLVTAAAAVTAGQKVFASTTDGSLTGAAAGATVSGSVETNWVIRESAAAGEVFHISNW